MIEAFWHGICTCESLSMAEMKEGRKSKVGVSILLDFVLHFMFPDADEWIIFF